MTSASAWPDRPGGFYEDWRVFCQSVLSAMLADGRAESGLMATVILGGGAVLGAAGLATIIRANKEAIDKKGREWGVDHLSTLALGGGAVVGAALGGVGGALANKILARMTDEKRVSALQQRLTTARRAFEAIQLDHEERRINIHKKKAYIEALFMKLADRS